MELDAWSVGSGRASRKVLCRGALLQRVVSREDRKVRILLVHRPTK
jgi:hypothetical protein